MSGSVSVVAVVYVFLSALFLNLSTIDAARRSNDEQIDRVEQLYVQGVALYRDGKYRRAIRRWEKAYAIYPDPRLLYNVGRGYESIGELEAADSHYRRCESHPRTSASLRAKANKRLSVIESAKFRSRQVKPISGRHISTAVGSPGQASGFNFLSAGKWSAGAAALGLLAGGAVVLTMGLADESKIDSARRDDGEVSSQMTRVQADTLRNSAERNQSIGWILLGAGVAFASASAALFVLDSEKHSESPTDGLNATQRDIKKASLLPRSLSFSVMPLIGGGAVLFRGVL